MSTGQYRIDFAILRRGDDDDDFSEIGFGSSDARPTVGEAASEVGAIVQNRLWETGPYMPDPREAS